MNIRTGVLLLIALALGPVAGVARADDTSSARTLYTRALERERTLRDAEQHATLAQLRAAARAYEAVVRRFPTSGYSDNALWQAANLASLAFGRFGQPTDRDAAVRLLTQLTEQYPSSSLVARAGETRQALTTAVPALPTATAATRTPVAPGPTAAAQSATDIVPPAKKGNDATAPTSTSGTTPAVTAVSGVTAIRDVKRTPLPDGTRVTIQLDGETSYRAERLERPRRVFFDVKGARPIASLLDATLTFNDDLVRMIRFGRQPQNTTRIVMDMEGADSYSVFTLYNPFRLVIDFKASAGARAVTASRPPTIGPALPLVASLQTPPPTPAVKLASLSPGAPAAPVESPDDVPTLPSRPVAKSPSSPPPSLPGGPSANSDGKFSLARQLGLGVSRIVIDAGHGGHDPGAHGNGVVEAELVLDVALRLNRLLQKQAGIEVVMTRDTDIFIPLEERTAIANREGADLFLSIHANASRNPKANGIETYFLNFASNPEAEAVAARENSGTSRSMHSLPDIVRAIALNNKIDESRDFADTVQRSMVSRLSTRNKLLRDLGVKQAPFVVLIGAAMPSVLAEISFVTHKQEGTLLKSGAYRQQIAEALQDAVLRYQQSLKRVKTAANQVGAR